MKVLSKLWRLLIDKPGQDEEERNVDTCNNYSEVALGLNGAQFFDELEHRSCWVIRRALNKIFVILHIDGAVFGEHRARD